MVSTARPARRALAGVAAFAAALAGVLALGPAVSAEAVSARPSAASAPNPAAPHLTDSGSPIVDTSHPASLTIHDLTATDPDGTEAPAPIDGAEFTIRQVVGIDLSAATGWANAFAVGGAFDSEHPEDSIATAGFSLGSPVSQTTDSSGTATFDPISTGMYLVEQTGGTASSVVNAVPFLAMTPITDPVNRDQWLYDVDVTPKNQYVPITSTLTSAFVTKTVDQVDGHHVGDNVTWTITGEILDGGDVLWWRMYDVLDSRLQFVSATAHLADGTPLTEGVDYDVSLDTGSNTAKIEFTGPAGSGGLEVLTQHHDSYVSIDIVTKLLTADTVPNTALLHTAIWDDPVGVVQYADPASAQVVINPVGGGAAPPSDPL